MNLSMHFGINKYDPTFYGPGADLRGCVNDAQNYYGLAKDLGYQERWLLTDEKVVKSAFLDMLDQASKMTQEGDNVMITYSCHGTQVLDTSGDEHDKLDEAICLHDGILYDDYFYRALTKFKPGIFINVVSDTCHSEGQVRSLGLIGSYPRFWEAKNVTRIDRQSQSPLQASVLQYAACRSTEVAWDEGDGGAFSKAMMIHLRSDRKRRPSALMDAVKRSVHRQTPVLHVAHATRAHRMREALAIKPYL